MFGDVRDPKAVGLAAAELATDEVGGDTVRRYPSPSPPAGKSLQSSGFHQQLDGAVTDQKALAERQLGMHPPRAVDTARRDVHRPDGFGQAGMAHRPNRRWPRLPVVETGLRDR